MPSDYESKSKLLARKQQLEQRLLGIKHDKEYWTSLLPQVFSVRDASPSDIQRRKNIERLELSRIHAQESLDLIYSEIRDLENPSPSVVPISAPNLKNQNAIEKLNTYLESKGLGLTEFAGKARITDRTLRSFRKGEKVTKSTLESIAKAMGLSRDKLLS